MEFNGVLGLVKREDLAINEATIKTIIEDNPVDYLLGKK